MKFDDAKYAKAREELSKIKRYLCYYLKHASLQDIEKNRKRIEYFLDENDFLDFAIEHALYNGMNPVSNFDKLEARYKVDINIVSERLYELIDTCDRNHY